MTPEQARTLYPEAVEAAAQTMYHTLYQEHPARQWHRQPHGEREDWRDDAAEVIASIATLGLLPKGTP